MNFATSISYLHRKEKHRKIIDKVLHQRAPDAYKFANKCSFAHICAQVMRNIVNCTLLTVEKIWINVPMIVWFTLNRTIIGTTNFAWRFLFVVSIYNDDNFTIKYIIRNMCVNVFLLGKKHNRLVYSRPRTLNFIR